MARHLIEIQRDLASLGDDPSAQYQSDKCALEQELLDAAREATARETAYWGDRREIEHDIETYHQMCAQITRALPPILAMMTEAVRFSDALDDRRSRLVGEGISLHIGQGPPPMERYDWVTLIGAELRRARRERW